MSILTKQPKIKNRIHYCRTIINLKQKEMAFLMGLSPSDVSRWEKGIRIPGVYYAIGLAVATQRLVDDLFSDFRREWQEKIRQRQKLLNSNQNGNHKEK